MSEKKVVLFGVGDFARVASVYLAQDSPHEVVAFTVHEAYRTMDRLLGKPVVPFEELTDLYPPCDHAMFVAMGFSKLNKPRTEVYHACKALGYEMITYVNSRAAVWGEHEIGENCFVFEQNVIQPFVRIGNNVVLWSGNHIGHDSVIGDHCFLASHVVISGNTRIGANCFFGVNATVRDGVTIGAECVIGAGALVLKDLPPQSVVKGLPAELSNVPSTRLKAV